MELEGVHNNRKQFIAVIQIVSKSTANHLRKKSRSLKDNWIKRGHVRCSLLEQEND
jgi:hypothetical protein